MSATTLVATVLRLLEKHGRQVTFRKLSATPGDANYPYDGPAVDDDTEVTGYIVEGDPGVERNASVGNDTEERGFRIFYARTSQDLESYHTVLDGTELRSILHIKRIQPGNTLFLYELRVVR